MRLHWLLPLLVAVTLEPSVQGRGSHGKVWDVQSALRGHRRNKRRIQRDELIETPDALNLLTLGRDSSPGVIAVLMICYNRPQYLQRALDTLLKYAPENIPAKKWVFVISQDGNDPRVSKVIDGFTSTVFEKYPQFGASHINHKQSAGNGYQKLSHHYGWALETVFNGLDIRVDNVIMLEDDLEVAPDFFSFFAAMAPLLNMDTTLLAASSYNDNGQPKFIDDPRRIVRSDFFPGLGRYSTLVHYTLYTRTHINYTATMHSSTQTLYTNALCLGWMMPRRIWDELGNKWPDGYWDDWLREPPQV
jgi:alpha-1,3-mannosyl-glycoprotein beta-1,2-N-acetylglucosaminyltransferase